MNIWKPVAHVVGKAAVALHYRRHLDVYSICFEHAPERAAEMNRKSIPTGIRWQVFRRDKFTCTYCGDKTSYLTLDHVIPLTHGGKTEVNNLIAACRKCNSRKSDKDFETFINSQWLNNRIKKVHQRSSTTLAQPPKVSPLVREMRSRIANATGRMPSLCSSESQDSSGGSRSKLISPNSLRNLKMWKQSRT